MAMSAAAAMCSLSMLDGHCIKQQCRLYAAAGKSMGRHSPEPGGKAAGGRQHTGQRCIRLIFAAVDCKDTIPAVLASSMKASALWPGAA